MLKFFILLAIAIITFIQIVPAYCAASRTAVLEVSATLPEHIMLNNNFNVTQFSNSTYQLVQTQTVIRNNKSISLTSIVVP